MLERVQILSGVGMMAATGINMVLIAVKASTPASMEELVAKRAAEKQKLAAAGISADGTVQVIMPADVRTHCPTPRPAQPCWHM